MIKMDRLCGLVVRVPGYRCGGPTFDPWRYQIFWQVVGLERGHSASWVQLSSYLRENSSGSGVESRKYGHREPSCWPRGTLYLQKLALTSPTIGGRSVSIVHSQTEATTFRSLYDENDNDSDTESANSTNGKFHSREPLI
jgi:hypothetical protein